MMNTAITSPLMLTEKDDDLLGAANRSDGMGVLAIWSIRARDLVPHLTEQTTEIRGFQILVAAFRLYELYEPKHPEHAGRLSDFFLLVEQAFARTVGWHDKAWPLPGARRVKARSSEEPHISLADPTWHLMDSQKANGIWGLYRGASRRAGLLESEMTRLSADTLEHARQQTLIVEKSQARLFGAIERAMEGETVALPAHLNNSLSKQLYDTFRDVPLAGHLQERLIDGHELNRELADRLLRVEQWKHRTFFADAMRELKDHAAVIQDTIHCENLLSVLESIMLLLCASRGKTLEAAAADIPVNLRALAIARDAFGQSGPYGSTTAHARHRRICEELDPSSQVALARSVLALHQRVSKGRNRAAWVWEESGVLHSDDDFSKPTDADLQVGVAWRNDYYLRPLQAIAKQLVEVRR